jgi:hypothetical protein
VFICIVYIITLSLILSGIKCCIVICTLNQYLLYCGLLTSGIVSERDQLWVTDHAGNRIIIIILLFQLRAPVEAESYI